MEDRRAKAALGGTLDEVIDVAQKQWITLEVSVWD